jgi:methyltransferase
LAYITVQRIVELWWAKQNETRLVAAGGVEFGGTHLPLMQLLHAAWLFGLWALAYDHPVQPLFLALFVLLQAGRFWVLATLGRRWTIRVIAVPGETLVAGGPYRFLRHPNYAIVIGEIAMVPLALGLLVYALVFSLLNALVLAIRIPQESAALAANRQR